MNYSYLIVSKMGHWMQNLKISVLKIYVYIMISKLQWIEVYFIKVECEKAVSFWQFSKYVIL